MALLGPQFAAKLLSVLCMMIIKELQNCLQDIRNVKIFHGHFTSDQLA